LGGNRKKKTITEDTVMDQVKLILKIQELFMTQGAIYNVHVGGFVEAKQSKTHAE
jgi:hypothetical protein